MGRIITKTLLFSLLFLQTSLFFTTIRAQSCKSYSFPSNQVFSSCNDLPVLNSFLHWTYDSSAGTADIAFRVTNVSPSSNWIAWALNPTGQGMTGAQALVAFQNSSGTIQPFTSSIASTTISSLTQSTLSFQVSKLSAMSRGREMVIFATVKPPKTTVNQVWQVGPVSGGSPAVHATTGANIRSTGSIDFLSGQTTSSGSLGGSRQRKKNVHGVLNAVSWGTLMPLGAIIARYLKVFKSADPAWFYVHIACQFSAYVVGVAGWGTGLKLGSGSPGVVYDAHRNIGITLFCLATLQVFALLVRPKKEHKYRFYWNIYHHIIGYTVIILSVINIFKGIDILDPEKKWKRTYTGVIIALGALAVVLEAFTWAVVLKRKKDSPEKHGHHGNGANAYNNGYGGDRTHPVV